MAFILLLGATALLLSNCASYEKVQAVSAEKLAHAQEGEFPNAETCGHCHVDIYAEWKSSPHAEAYTDPAYKTATVDYRFEDCLGCHIPEPQYTPGRPSARQSFREEGVTCVTCHLEEGKLSGPLESTALVLPHPVGVNPDRYRSAEMCGRCHEGTYAEWKASPIQNKQTCQECHMPSIERRVTQSTDAASSVIVSFEDKVPQKRHIFRPIPTELKDPPYHLQASPAPDGLVISVQNNIPHALPTGDFGMRDISIEAYSIQKNGQMTLLGNRELTRKLKTAIASGETLKWSLKISTSAVSALELRFVRYSNQGRTKLDLYKQRLPVQ